MGGFTITSQSLVDLERHTSSVDLGKQVARAADDVEQASLGQLLRTAAGRIGASYDLQDEIGTHLHDGAVYVGVPESSPFYTEAVDLEWGTATAAPRGWLRGVVAQNQRDLTEVYSRALTNRLLGTQL